MQKEQAEAFSFCVHRGHAGGMPGGAGPRWNIGGMHGRDAGMECWMARPGRKTKPPAGKVTAEGKSVQRFILDILEDHLGIAQGDDNTADS